MSKPIIENFSNGERNYEVNFWSKFGVYENKKEGKVGSDFREANAAGGGGGQSSVRGSYCAVPIAICFSLVTCSPPPPCLAPPSP